MAMAIQGAYGYNQIFGLWGGFSAWTQAGFETVG